MPLVVSGLTNPAGLPTAAAIAGVRRMLHDHPFEVVLASGVSSTSTTTVSVSSADGALLADGNLLEFNDGTGEQVLVISGAGAGSTGSLTVRRASNGSSAAVHASGCVVFVHPRWSYNLISDAWSTSVANDLWPEVYDIQQHQITSSATTNTYDVSTTDCERWLAIYQLPNANSEPRYLDGFTKQLWDADTSLYPNGKVGVINQRLGPVGDPYYVVCAHKLTNATLTDAQVSIVQQKTCAYLLQWAELPRSAGPSDQGDRTIGITNQAKLASVFNAEYQRLLHREAAHLRSLYKPKRQFLRGTP